MDTLIMNCLEQTFEETPSSLILEAPEMKTPSGKQKSLRETLMMFRKNTRKQTAPSRAALCIEEEHVQKIKYMRKEERSSRQKLIKKRAGIEDGAVERKN
ncbi:unnamed protein product [Larinioides sclopetarius]